MPLSDNNSEIYNLKSTDRLTTGPHLFTFTRSIPCDQEIDELDLLINDYDYPPNSLSLAKDIGLFAVLHKKNLASIAMITKPTRTDTIRPHFPQIIGMVGKTVIVDKAPGWVTCPSMQSQIFAATTVIAALSKQHCTPVSRLDKHTQGLVGITLTKTSLTFLDQFSTSANESIFNTFIEPFNSENNESIILKETKKTSELLKNNQNLKKIETLDMTTKLCNDDKTNILINLQDTIKDAENSNIINETDDIIKQDIALEQYTNIETNTVKNIAQENINSNSKLENIDFSWMSKSNAFLVGNFVKYYYPDMKIARAAYSARILLDCPKLKILGNNPFPEYPTSLPEAINFSVPNCAGPAVPRMKTYITRVAGKFQLPNNILQTTTSLEHFAPKLHEIALPLAIAMAKASFDFGPINSFEQLWTKTEKNDSNTEKNDYNTEKNGSNTEKNDYNTEKNGSNTEKNGSNTEKNDSNTEKNGSKTEKNDSNTEKNDYNTEEPKHDNSSSTKRKCLNFIEYTKKKPDENFPDGIPIYSTEISIENNNIELDQKTKPNLQLINENLESLEQIIKSNITPSNNNIHFNDEHLTSNSRYKYIAAKVNEPYKNGLNTQMLKSTIIPSGIPSVMNMFDIHVPNDSLLMSGDCRAPISSNKGEKKTRDQVWSKEAFSSKGVPDVWNIEQTDTTETITNKTIEKWGDDIIQSYINIPWYSGLIDIRSIAGHKTQSIISQESFSEFSKQGGAMFVPIVYDESSDTTLVLCALFTGRTHQLRIQLSGLGHPICGDSLYSTENSTILDLNQNNSNGYICLKSQFGIFSDTLIAAAIPIWACCSNFDELI